ncbi:HesA/MoeB/ThiF family protein [Sulfitobacter geojensis]|uniref:ThiF family adenylyltransferase n=1 Tax=Sulfitobacter geojensis TaxID=1342299 RepID=A0AAE2VYA0_9RHOB|nr:ThiF family adenylyltransferase [Sulfitobacter geojensis]MBM1689278.1 ThiF family adenylyltransferase [Sulfitobacter geojensis]MBM1693344.1 ThiF family adenylyltransferase [Sulfitobacter geojensis]MBM1705510.1 ThiF family adenylyltransferase [Sulfitobacter geojensis]MBM1709568.1 ThiF family adenylyltransferase [Sulfitobacter geojensis]MBM1713634.1 ThiF family adenylyltransferase [Sulfitobacter geojensis]
MTGSLALTETQHSELKTLLFPGDGFESAAILLCRFTGPAKERLIVSGIMNVPDELCATRTPKFIGWPGQCIEDAIDRAEQHADAIVLIHSHPGGMLAFSKVDDDSDTSTMPALFSAIEAEGFHHGSAIMVPDGTMIARLYRSNGDVRTINLITRVGHNISGIGKLSSKTVMPFGAAMTKGFSAQTACVIGVSGTGTLVAELLARKGVGHLILIDFDTMEHKNLNRIINSTKADAEANRAKVEMMAAAIKQYAPNTRVTIINASIEERNAIIAASAADILFSCVDSMTGRSIAELICQSCVIPLVDLGVTIPTRTDATGHVHVADVCGRIDYVRPDGPSLTDRMVVTPEGLRREYLLQHAPDAAQKEIEAGYIKGVHEEAPSVMALNMRAAGDAVMEWIARQFDYRHDGNWPYARTVFSLAGGEVDFDNDASFPTSDQPDFARGLVEPLLGLPALAKNNLKDAA